MKLALPLAIGLLVFSAACSKADTAEGRSNSKPTTLTTPTPAPTPGAVAAAPTRADFARVFAHFQENANLGSKKPIDPSYQPEVVLPQLHGYFKIGQTLKSYKAGGFTGFLLKRLPDQVLRDLQAAAFGPDQNTGFAVLQSTFWTRAAELMKQGFKIGFVESDPKMSINGVYFHETKMILIDVEANVGVLEHEYHHHVQYTRLDSRDDYSAATLSDTCLSQASRFFAELDATTVEFHTWENVFNTYDVFPPWMKTCRDPNLSLTLPYNDGQMLSLNANLAYPKSALAWIDPTECPNELIQAANSTAAYVSDGERNRASELVGGMAMTRMTLLDDQVELNTACAGPQSAQQSSICQETQTDLADRLKDTDAAKIAWSQYVEGESSKRAATIRQILSALPEAIKQDLCFGAAGFEYLTDCETYTGKLPTMEN